MEKMEEKWPRNKYTRGNHSTEEETSVCSGRLAGTSFSTVDSSTTPEMVGRPSPRKRKRSQQRVELQGCSTPVSGTGHLCWWHWLGVKGIHADRYKVDGLKSTVSLVFESQQAPLEEVFIEYLKSLSLSPAHSSSQPLTFFFAVLFYISD